VNSRDVTQRKTAEERLRLQHEFSQRLIETAQVIILVLDRDGRIVLYNTFLEELVGIRLEEVRGQDWFRLFVPERVRQTIRGVFESALGAHRIRGYVNPIVTKSGREREIEWYDAVLTDASGQVSELLCIGHDVTERKRADEALRQSEAALRRSQNELRALAGRLIGNEEAEHRRLARELHDDFNQRLTALVFGMAEWEKEFPPDAAGHVTKLRRLQNEIASLSDDMRLLAHQLHPAAVELLGLPVALRQQCQEASHAGTLSVRFAARKLPSSIPREVALCLYRVAQESLRNAARHSGADRVSVMLYGVAGGIRLSISDNGAGFDPDAAQSGGGLGHISMRERIRIVHGALTIDSRPGRGTRIVADVPLRGGR
jgi:PAS domain S-box-containing protein